MGAICCSNDKDQLWYTSETKNRSNLAAGANTSMISCISSIDTVSQKSSPKSDVESPTGNCDEDNGIWVKRWIDYSDRYGLAYLLSNNRVGAIFKDSTRMILAADGLSVDCINQKSDRALQPKYKQVMKKVKLLLHF